LGALSSEWLPECILNDIILGLRLCDRFLCCSNCTARSLEDCVRLQPRSRYVNNCYTKLILTFSLLGLPDGGFFGKNSKKTLTPLHAIWFTTFVSVLPGLLDLASPIAANAIFSLAAMSLDLSYIIPIFCRRVFHSHPEVMFKPGPFYIGDGWLGLACNITCIGWTLFVCVIFSLPTVMPVTGENMNYASVRIFGNSESITFFDTLLQVITIGVVVLALYVS
jgi:hypothetical protein